MVQPGARMDGEGVSPEQLALVTEDGRSLAPVTEPGIVGLLERALDKGHPVEVLSQLMDLQERIETRNARTAFFDAVAAFQDECPEIRKTKKATITPNNGRSGFQYGYAPLEQITRTIRPILKKHGLAYSWTVEQSNEKTMHVVCVLRHIDGHEERASFPVPIDGGGRMSGAQSHGAALTYGRRQSLIAVLGLTTADEDNDAPRGKETTKRITSAQARQLGDRLDALDANTQGFLEWLGGLSDDGQPFYRKLSDILVSDYARAITAIEEKEAAR